MSWQPCWLYLHNFHFIHVSGVPKLDRVLPLSLQKTQKKGYFRLWVLFHASQPHDNDYSLLPSDSLSFQLHPWKNYFIVTPLFSQLIFLLKQWPLHILCISSYMEVISSIVWCYFNWPSCFSSFHSYQLHSTFNFQSTQLIGLLSSFIIRVV